MWQNRWARIGAVALGIFVINGIARLISRLTQPKGAATSASDTVNQTNWTVIAVIGVAAIVVLLGVLSARWSVRRPFSQISFELGAASVIGALLALLVGPFIGGTAVFADRLEGFVLQFLQFLLFCAIGIAMGYVAMIVAGRDWKSRGLKEYALRHGGTRKPHRDRVGR